jgi:hypothetical protein
MIISPIDTKAHYQALVDQYRSKIPADLKNILLPDDTLMSEFAIAIKRLRSKEEERYYVTEIQRRHRIPLRPNESVKQAMIRARLAIIKRRREAGDGEDSVETNGPLPTDPLE